MADHLCLSCEKWISRWAFEQGKMCCDTPLFAVDNEGEKKQEKKQKTKLRRSKRLKHVWKVNNYNSPTLVDILDRTPFGKGTRKGPCCACCN